MNKKTGELERLRRQVEAVDKTIIKSLSKRVKLVEDIGRYKFAHNISFLDKTRRDNLLAVWTASGKSLRLPAKLVRDIFSSIHRHSLEIEKTIKKN
ncbi:MAG: chorismate mutase [Patescibacteria group bacterium]